MLSRSSKIACSMALVPRGLTHLPLVPLAAAAYASAALRRAGARGSRGKLGEFRPMTSPHRPRKW
jgi:hypothetical protein